MSFGLLSQVCALRRVAGTVTGWRGAPISCRSGARKDGDGAMDFFPLSFSRNCERRSDEGDASRGPTQVSRICGVRRPKQGRSRGSARDLGAACPRRCNPRAAAECFATRAGLAAGFGSDSDVRTNGPCGRRPSAWAPEADRRQLGPDPSACRSVTTRPPDPFWNALRAS